MDKNKGILAVMCPRGYIKRLQEMAYGSPGFSMRAPLMRDVVSHINEGAEEFAYTSVRVFKEHEVGKYKGIPKESGLETKMRPLGSYFRHALRNLLSLGSRVLVFGVSLNAGYSPDGYSNERSRSIPIPILSVQPAIRSLNAQRMIWQEKLQMGFSLLKRRAKKDLIDFFGRVPRSLVWRALDWMLCQIGKVHGPRRGVVAIPRMRKSLSKKRISVTFQMLGTLMRKPMTEQAHPRLQQCALSSKEHYVLKLKDIVKLVKLEFSTAMLKFGKVNVCWIDGTTQGSNFSMGIAMVCSGFID